MADVNDARLEQLLRTTLRAETADLPVVVRPGDVLRRRQERRRGPTRLRTTLRLLALAAALVLPLAIAIGIGSSPRLDPRPVHEVIPTGPMTESRTLHAAALLTDGRVLLTGGNGPLGEALTSAEVFDPASGTFTPTREMSAARQQHTATLLDDGHVLVTGDGSADLFDPETGTFSPTGQPLANRYGHAAVKLAGGRVLIVGGAAPGAQRGGPPSLVGRPIPQPVAEIYDPASESFSSVIDVDPRLQRLGHSLLPLPDGTVLVLGGGQSGSYFRDAHRPAIIDPIQGTVRGIRGNHFPVPFRSFGLTLGVAVLPEGGALLMTESDTFQAEDEPGTYFLSRYDPVAETVRFVRELRGDHHGTTGDRLVTLADGSVLVLLDTDRMYAQRDQDTTRPLNLEALVFDPASDALRDIGSLPIASGAVVTPLKDGGALVTGFDLTDERDSVDIGTLVR